MTRNLQLTQRQRKAINAMRLHQRYLDSFDEAHRSQDERGIAKYARKARYWYDRYTLLTRYERNRGLPVPGER